ncbi:MAG: hypothetical protein Q9182_006475 [Xanthomendoza sp. 2 TL-2023]
MTIARPSTAPSRPLWTESTYQKTSGDINNVTRPTISTLPVEKMALPLEKRSRSENTPPLLKTRATRPPSPPQLKFPYHVPNTDTTLIINWEDNFYPQAFVPAIRHLLGIALTDLDLVIDVAGSGIIPGPSNEYKIQRIFNPGTDAPITGILAIGGDWHSDSARVMTYAIARDVAKGLWSLMAVSRRESALHSCFVIYRGKVIGTAVLAVFWS